MRWKIELRAYIISIMDGYTTSESYEDNANRAGHCNMYIYDYGVGSGMKRRYIPHRGNKPLI